MDQTPQSVYHAYEMPVAGSLAAGSLVTLMLALVITAIYAEYRWARGLKRPYSIRSKQYPQLHLGLEIINRVGLDDWHAAFKGECQLVT